MSEMLAVIAPPGMRDMDLCFPSEMIYQKFVDRCKAALRMGENLLDEYHVVPLFRGETRVVPVVFRMNVIPAEVMATWLSKLRES